MNLLNKYPIGGVDTINVGEYDNLEMYPAYLCSFHSHSPFRIGNKSTNLEDIEFHGNDYNDFLHFVHDIQNQHKLRILSISQDDDNIDGTLWRNLFTNLSSLKKLQRVALRYPPPAYPPQAKVKSWSGFPPNVKLELEWKSLGNPKDNPLPPPTVNIEKLSIDLLDYFPHALRKEVYPSIKFLSISDVNFLFHNVSGFSEIIKNVPNLEELEISPHLLNTKKILKYAPKLKKLIRD
jgi:hypothetical protein